jgi:hypothetical protein
MRSTAYFSLDNADTWALDKVYQVFSVFRKAASTSSLGTAHLDAQPGSNVTHSQPPLNIVDLSSKTMAAPVFQLGPCSSRKRKRSKSNTDVTLACKKAKNPTDENTHPTPLTMPKRCTKRSKARKPSEAISITSKESVSKIIQIEEAPSCFTVYSEPTAYFLDLSRHGAIPDAPDGTKRTVSAFVRLEVIITFDVVVLLISNC